MRIVNANQLHRGMVLTLHHPQTHRLAIEKKLKPYDEEGHVVTDVQGNYFRAVRVTNVRGCQKHHDVLHFFEDNQIISEAVQARRKNACNWAEHTGEKTEEEVQQMLSDDCLVCN